MNDFDEQPLSERRKSKILRAWSHCGRIFDYDKAVARGAAGAARAAPLFQLFFFFFFFFFLSRFSQAKKKN